MADSNGGMIGVGANILGSSLDVASNVAGAGVGTAGAGAGATGFAGMSVAPMVGLGFMGAGITLEVAKAILSEREEKIRRQKEQEAMRLIEAENARNQAIMQAGQVEQNRQNESNAMQQQMIKNIAMNRIPV
jgi:hypothetical protein